MSTETTQRHTIGTILHDVDGKPIAIVTGYPDQALTFDPAPAIDEVVDHWHDSLDFVPDDVDIQRLREEFGGIAKPEQWFHAVSEADFEERGAEAPDWCGPDFDGEMVHVLVLSENDSFDAIERVRREHDERIGL